MSIFRWLSLLPWLLRTAGLIYGPLRRQLRQLAHEMQASLADPDYLDRSQQRRMFQYAAVGTLLLEALSALHGRRSTAQERKALVYLSALAPVVDDLSDEEQQSAQQIMGWLRGETVPVGNLSGLARALYVSLLCHVQAPQARLEHYGMQLMVAQEQSVAQLRARPLPEATLRTLTYQKGASSLWIYRALLPEPVLPGEETALGTLGYLIQWINDLFDVYKDRDQGQQTLFTCGADMRQREQEFHAQLARLRQELADLPYPTACIQGFWQRLALLLGRGQVGLDQLRQLQGGAPRLVDLQRYSRAELVVDMEKGTNLWAGLRHAHHLGSAHPQRAAASP